MLLSVLEDRRQSTVYLALDLSRSHLVDDLSILAPKHSAVLCQGVCGTYTEATTWCTSIPTPRLFLWLGSSLFRGSREEALAHLQSWAALMGPDDILFAGHDGHLPPLHHDKIWAAYHADEAMWQRLWDNGFQCANEIVGEPWFRSADWRLDAVITTEPVCQHRFRFRAQRDVVLGSSGVAFRKGDELGWLDGHRFSEPAVRDISECAGLEVVQVWKADDSEMCKHTI